MPAPSTMYDVSTTAASNYPAGSDTPSALDDSVRALASVVKQNVTKGSDITSASTITIPASGGYFVVTGVTGISTISDTNSWFGREVTLKFSGVLTITHSSGLILPGSTNITTAAGDVGKFVNESTGVWRCVAWALNGGSFQPYDVDTLKADTADVLTAGFAATPYNAGTKSTGTYTPDEANGNFQYCVNGGAFTLAPPTNNCTLVVQITNNASAGTITTSGFTKVTGSTPGTTNGDDFIAYITKINGFSHLAWQALQ